MPRLTRMIGTDPGPSILLLVGRYSAMKSSRRREVTRLSISVSC